MDIPVLFLILVGIVKLRALSVIGVVEWYKSCWCE